MSLPNASAPTGFIRVPKKKSERRGFKTAVAYIRVSTDRQELGPEAQSAAIHKWCAENNVCLVAEHREVCSGATPISRRDQFMFAVRETEEYAADYFIVAKRDRLARDVIQAGVAEQMVSSVGARLLSIDDPAGNRIGPEAQLIRVILDAIAEFERARIAMRIREALAIKKRNGERIGSIPYGKRKDANGILLQDDAQEQKIIDIVVDLRSKGKSCNAIVRHLTENGYRTRRGKTFATVQVMRIVHLNQSRIDAAKEAAAPWGSDDKAGD